GHLAIHGEVVRATEVVVVHPCRAGMLDVDVVRRPAPRFHRLTSLLRRRAGYRTTHTQLHMHARMDSAPLNNRPETLRASARLRATAIGCSLDTGSVVNMGCTWEEDRRMGSLESTRRRAAVLGSPIRHSLSPTLHVAAYTALGLTGWRYDAV